MNIKFIIADSNCAAQGICQEPLQMPVCEHVVPIKMYCDKCDIKHMLDDIKTLVKGIESALEKRKG